MNSIKDKVKEILSNVLDVDINLISEEFSKKDSDNWDSIKHLNLVIVIEEEFNFQIDDDLIPELDSFDKIYMLITNNIK